jgi:DNA-binding NtrC family response regulator
MMSGHASIDTALEANELGAAGFLEKPITLQRLLSTVHKIITRSSPLIPNPTAAAVGMVASTATPDTPKMTDVPVHVTSFDTPGVARGTPTAPMPVATAGGVASLSKWQLDMANTPLETPLREFREASERIYFENLLDRTHNSMTQVSEISGLERTHLYRKLKQLGIDVKRIKKLAS